MLALIVAPSLHKFSEPLEFFAFNTKLPEMAMLASNDFTTAKKLPPVGLNLMIIGSGV